MEITYDRRNEIISLLEEGVCPICGKSNLKMVLCHINKAHGIDRNTVKAILLLNNHKGFASSELSEIKRDNCIKNNNIHNLEGHHYHSKSLSELTKTKCSNTHKELYKDNEDYRKSRKIGLALANTSESIMKRANTNKLRFETDPNYREAIRRNVDSIRKFALTPEARRKAAKTRYGH